MSRHRTEIAFDDLQKVLDAAALLRKYNLITPTHVYAIRGNVNADVQTLLKRLRSQMSAEQYDTLTALREATKPA
jgi:hypothetical protein